MSRLTELSENFKFGFERFINACDAIEESNSWDVDEYGEMDVYYSADLVSILLNLVAADGNITNSEVAYLNDFFGLDYTIDELSVIFDEYSLVVENIFDREIENSISLIRSINEKLADAYVDLIRLACDIIIESDGVISAPEIELAHRIKDLAE